MERHGDYRRAGVKLCEYVCQPPPKPTNPPVGPICGRPCHPSAIISATCAQRDPAGFTEPVADFVRGMFAKSLSRLLNSLAAAIWLGIAMPIQAASVTITDHTPQAVTPGWAAVTLTLDVSGIVVDPILDIPEELGVICTGGDIDGGDFPWYLYTSGVYPMSMWVGNIDGDITFVATMVGGSDTLTIPCGKITSIEARMVQDTSATVVTAANFDQDVFIKAIFSPVWLPTGLTVDDVSWAYPLSAIAGEPWAKLPAPNAPGHPTVQAQLGSTVVSLDIWQVKVMISQITLKGSDFAEVIKDPTSFDPSPNYVAPHWEGGEAKPVQYKAGSQMQADAKFSVEPVEYASNVKVKAAGAYEISEMGESPAAGLLEISGFSMAPCEAFPDEAGLETPMFGWEFAVGESSFSDAGSSTLDIYRTLATPAAQFRTIVHIACTKTSSSDATEAFSDIWGYIADKNVTRWNGGESLTYYGSPFDYGKNLFTLILKGHGDCDAWMQLLIAVQAVHGNQLSSVKAMPKEYRRLFEPDGPMLTRNPDGGMWTKSLSGQGTINFTGPFRYHVAAHNPSTNMVYDPSLGISRTSGPIWAEDVFESAEYVYVDANNDIDPDLGGADALGTWQ